MTTDAPELYPLRFESILKEKVWGGRRLSTFGKTLPADGARIGESWEVADLQATSPDGGGGDAAISMIANGSLQGTSLSRAIELWSGGLLGRVGLRRAKELAAEEGVSRPVFPLLVKLLDASEHLSVQVHPSPEYAGIHSDAKLKTESWIVLDVDNEASSPAKSPAQLFTGLNRYVSRREFEQRAVDGTLAEVLVSHEPKIGDCYTLPSGTCHALGAGVLVAEVQTPSDTTFRVYDWIKEYNRVLRELHVKQASACIAFGSAEVEGPTPIRIESESSVVAETPYYRVNRISRDWSHVGPAHSFSILMLTNGHGVVRWSSSSTPDHAISIKRGDTVLIPAGLVCQLEGDSIEALRVSLPE